MKNLIANIVSVITLLNLSSVNAQVLFSDDFESYNVGPFLNNTNGWLVNGFYNDIRIVTEPNRGKVLAWGWNTSPIGLFSSANCLQSVTLNKYYERDPGNDVLKWEFEFCSKDFSGNLAELFESSAGFDGVDYYFRCNVNANESTIDSSVTHPSNYKKPYNHSWIKVEVYFEYFEITDTWEIHIYIPMLKYWAVQKRSSIPFNIIYLNFGVYKPIPSYSGALIKYDNIKLTAVPNRPAFVNVNEWISSKFNVYPNPATNVVNISNSENMLVNQVAVYDISGKQLITQTFNTEKEIQVNVENLPSGTFILHLETNQGIAVKKLVKK